MAGFPPRRSSSRADAAFTLLELVAVVVIIAILAVLALPIVENVRSRAEAAKCIGNLRTLYGAAALHVQDRGVWPQVPFQNGDIAAYSRGWIDALKPYGPEQSSWICPGIQRRLGGPDLSDPQNARIDYLPTAFDENPRRAYEFPTQPWFGEVGDTHGNGNLLILTNGSIRTLKDMVRDQRR